MAIPRKSKPAPPVAAPVAAPVIMKPVAAVELPAAEAVSEAAITAAVAPVSAALSTIPPAAPKLDTTEIFKAAEAASVDFQTALKQNAEKAMAEAKAAQERVRLAAEQSLEQTRAAYEKIKVAAEEATSSLESSYAAATRGWTEFHQKTLGAMKAHADAHFEHVKAMLAAKTMPEVIDLQTAHVKASFEAANEQIKELACVAQKVATEAGEPIKAALTKRFAA
jgi:phasin